MYTLLMIKCTETKVSVCFRFRQKRKSDGDNQEVNSDDSWTSVETRVRIYSLCVVTPVKLS